MPRFARRPRKQVALNKPKCQRSTHYSLPSTLVHTGLTASSRLIEVMSDVTLRPSTSMASD
jgi:hypothetical protein